jgi:tetratricopeptide (TPR) repeat protein
MLINAQAQKEHEDRIQAEKGGGGPSETATTDSAKNNTDSRAENAQPKENQEKGKETAKEKQDSKNSDGKSSETAKKAPSSGPSSNAMSPVQEALFLIQAKKYQDSLSVLSPIIGKNSNNLDARYLMAISYVAMRKYPEAAEQYKKIIEIAPNSKQAALSVEGLRKIGQ